ncbi:MAG: toxin-antitoxin system HicB family antitoxin [Cyanothece sp. SIO2G6]|nr:toxin-antitoxin system HicB family antitoxin [Cyanothece sp. SIO2G6]
MSTLSIQLPDSLYKSLRRLAEQDGISLDQFITLAVAEKISALMTEGYLQERASRGVGQLCDSTYRTKYEAVLAKVADVEPEFYDQLPPA